MAWSTPVKQTPFFVFENPGDKLTGILRAIRTVDGKFGDQPVADLERIVEGNATGTVSITISAGLNALTRSELLDEKIQIEYLGVQLSQKTQRNFKAFEVRVWEDSL